MTVFTITISFWGQQFALIPLPGSHMPPLHLDSEVNFCPASGLYVSVMDLPLVANYCSQNKNTTKKKKIHPLKSDQKARVLTKTSDGPSDSDIQVTFCFLIIMHLGVCQVRINSKIVFLIKSTTKLIPYTLRSDQN